MSVRVRFAPSPTGKLHIGGVRTALYNYLFARNKGGKFLLRIEDTDPERSKKELIDVIIKGLSWLGLDPDEPPLRQSERLNIYREIAHQLVREKKAYFCYCTEQEIQEEKRIAKLTRKPFKYSRKCLNRSSEEIEKLKEKGRKPGIRLFIPEGKTSFNDIVHKEITYNNNEIEDFIILRSDGSPTYQLACVMDDHAMGITHVIRGDDHISNTPKQIILYRTLNYKIPEFAHLPMILGPDKKRLSKRHGATSVLEFQREGFLPEALFNFLTLLGWSPGENREIISLEESIKLFNINRVNKRACVFDHNKLLWMNSEYVKKTSNAKLFELSLPFFKEKSWFNEKKHGEMLKQITPLFKPRIRTLKEFPDFSDYFFIEDYTYDKEGIEKYFINPRVFEGLEELIQDFSKLELFNHQTVERVVREKAKEIGEKPAFLIHPLRLALTGKRVGPGVFELMEAMGKEGCLRRIKRTLKQLWGYVPKHTRIEKI